MIHAHKRYNGFEELFIALHRTLPVRSISTVRSVHPGERNKPLLAPPFAIMANAFVKPVPSLRAETCTESCVLISVTPFLFASSASNTASSHRSHRKSRWRNTDRPSWRKGEGCCNIGCLRCCSIQILEDARLCETGCSIESRVNWDWAPRTPCCGVG